MKRLALYAVALALQTMPATAHHAISAVYDASRKATIEGVVAGFQFVNPHPFVLMDEGDAGTPERWTLEMDNRSELAVIGVTADTLKPGDRVVVTGSLARSRARQLYISRLDRLADGFRYEQIGSSPRVSWIAKP
jgi:hypothetical protein